jgi:hypothetical protein
MPRIRTIKPEFWEDERVGRVSLTARLLFIGLWTVADDAGRFRANARLLAAQIFPYDDGLDVGQALEELDRERLIQLYEVDGQKYGHVRNFLKHQRIKKPGEPRFPPPPPEEGSSSSPPVRNQFPTSSEPVPHQFPTSGERVPPGTGNREQGTGNRNREQGEKDCRFPSGNSSTSPAGEADRSGPESSHSRSNGGRARDPRIGIVFQHWLQRMNKDPTRTKLTPQRRAKIQARLRDSSLQEILAAIDRCAESPWHMGENDRGKPYNDLTLILRSRDKLEWWLEDKPKSQEELEREERIRQKTELVRRSIARIQAKRNEASQAGSGR